MICLLIGPPCFPLLPPGISNTVGHAVLSFCGRSSPHSRLTFVSALFLPVVYPTWIVCLFLSWPVHFLDERSHTLLFSLRPSPASLVSPGSCRAFVSALPLHSVRGSISSEHKIRRVGIHVIYILFCTVEHRTRTHQTGSW